MPTLTHGPVPRALFNLTAPMVLGISSTILVQILELGFIGRLGTAHVAAITFTFPLTMLLSSVALGINIGTSSVVARGVGSGSQGDARALSTHSLILVFSTMLVLTVVGWLSIDPLFRQLGAGESLLPLIHSYLDIYLPSALLFTITMVAAGVARANGHATVPGYVMTFGALLTLVLDPILIFGWFGFPRMELAGAAAAAAVARIFTSGVLLYYVYQREFISLLSPFRGIWGSCRKILHIGIPAMLTQMIGPVTAAIITRMLASHGEVVVAGFGVATRIEAVCVMLLFALSSSIGPFVGQNWGAKRVDRVDRGMFVTYVFCIAWGLFGAVLCLLFGRIAAGWIDQSQDVVHVATAYLMIVPWSYGLWGVLMMSSASFNALGKPLPSTMLSFTRMFIVYVPLALLLDRAFGYSGIFIATATSNALLGIAGFIWFRRYYITHDP